MTKLWTGEYIGSVGSSVQVLERFKGKNGNYWKFQYNNHVEYALVLETDSILPCLLDELKPIFKLDKIGTSYCKCNGKIYILYKVIYTTTPGRVLEDWLLPEVKSYLQDLHNPQVISIREKIKNLLLFRLLFAVTQTYESHVWIRVTKNSTVSNVISMRETVINPMQKILSPSMYVNWFGTYNVAELLARWLEIFTLQDYHRWINSFEYDFKKVQGSVERTKGETSWVFSVVKDRLFNLLESFIRNNGVTNGSGP